MQQRPSPSEFYQQTPPNRGKMQQVLSDLNDGRLTSDESKRAPTGDDLCLLASLASTVAWLRDSKPVEGRDTRTQQERIYHVACVLKDALDWSDSPLEYDLTGLLTALKALGDPGSSLSPFSDLHAEWLKLRGAGVPLFQIDAIGDRLWVTDPPLPAPQTP